MDRSLQFFVGRDSSVFLYVARRIQEGGLPYRDVWDHKPPLIYYLDLAGLWLADRGLPGLALVELAALVAAACAGAWALHRALGALAAMFGSVAWLALLAVTLDGGNLPEEYALPLQLGAVALYVAGANGARSRGRCVAIGACAGLALLLKPTVLGIWAAIFIAEAIAAWRRRSLRAIALPVAAALLGALAVTLPVAAYLVAAGIAADAFDQAVRFNFHYSQATLGHRLVALLHGIGMTSFSGLLPVALVGWVAAVVRLARGSARGPAARLLAVAVVALPLDFALASWTGRPGRQYFLACLPVLGLLAGIAAASLRPPLERAALKAGVPRSAFVGTAIVLAFALFASAIPAVAIYRHDDGMTDQERSREAATAYVIRATRPADRVLFWGGESGLNYTTGRRAPTRYAYQYALFQPGYADPARIDELLAELDRDVPALIVDATPGTTDLPLDGDARARALVRRPGSALPLRIERLFDWVARNYEQVDTVGPLRWPVYARRS